MRYLRVKNWSEFQHYKDRNPPWIKLHRTLLDDYEFSCLQDASKAHLMLIWLFASQKDGCVPDDPAFLKKKLGLEKEPNLKLFIDHGLLILEHVASNSLADCQQSAPLEESYKASYKTTETEERQPRSQGSRLPPGWFPSESLKAWAEKERGDLDVITVIASFRDYWIGVPGSRGLKLDWDATFRNWVRKERQGGARKEINYDAVVARLEAEEKQRAGI